MVVPVLLGNCSVAIFTNGGDTQHQFEFIFKPFYDCESVITEINSVPIFYVLRIEVVEC